VAKRKDISFRGAVDPVESLGRYPNDRCDVDDCARTPRDERRRGGIGQARESCDAAVTLLPENAELSEKNAQNADFSEKNAERG